MKTFFVGTAGFALLAVIGTLAGSAWLTANQRAEAEKPEPWAYPSFTTTAVTTGGMLARWMDNDGNLETGHSYIQGIYGIWKVNHKELLNSMNQKVDAISTLPPLWQQEFTRDTSASRDNSKASTEKSRADAAKRQADAIDEVFRKDRPF